MAGAPEAEVFVLAIGNPQSSIETAKIIREKFPHLKSLRGLETDST